MSRKQPFKKLILLLVFALSGLNSYGQVNTLSTEDDNGMHIIDVLDSTARVVDGKKSKLLNLKLFPDSIIGEKIVSVKKQHFKSLTKYTFKTNRDGKRMDVKYIILYAQYDKLILAKICYDMEANLFFENYYYSNEICYYRLLSERGMRFSKDGKDVEFLECFKKILSLKKCKR